MQANDDTLLVLACRQGDPAAWEALVRRYQRLIYTISRRAGLSDDLAAEVFQRVFVTLIEHLDRIEQPDRIGAWLATTARRESWRQLRRERATITLADGETDDDETEWPVDAAPLPDEIIERLERQHAVRLAVAGLDERCRTLLNLLFYRVEPPPYAEIATALGVSEGSIGPTRARCLQKLRRVLDGVDL